MDYEIAKKGLNKVFEDIGGMVSSAAGITGIEGINKGPVVKVDKGKKNTKDTINDIVKNRII